jgi:hypothetical protein
LQGQLNLIHALLLALPTPPLPPSPPIHPPDSFSPERIAGDLKAGVEEHGSNGKPGIPSADSKEVDETSAGGVGAEATVLLLPASLSSIMIPACAGPIVNAASISGDDGEGGEDNGSVCIGGDGGGTGTTAKFSPGVLLPSALILETEVCSGMLRDADLHS